MVCSTRARVAGSTEGSLLITRDTVFSDTPARSATVLIVGLRGPAACSLIALLPLHVLSGGQVDSRCHTFAADASGGGRLRGRRLALPLLSCSIEGSDMDRTPASEAHYCVR